MNKANFQHGFNLAMIIAIVVLIGVIGFVAWRVYDATAQTNNSLSNAETSSNAESVKTEDKASNPQEKKTVIPHVDYKVDLPDDLSGLVFYEKSFDDGSKTVSISTKELVSMDPGCDAEHATPLGTLVRQPGKYDQVKPRRGLLVKQFDGYFIAYSGPQAACSGDEAVIQKQEELSKAFYKALGLN